MERKVLIIDDSRTTVEKVKRNLQEAGLTVIAHVKSMSALSIIMSEQPDLILLEAEMPLLFGSMLCRLIRKNRLIATTPIILYSSLDKKRLEKKLTEWKVQGYIPKSQRMEQVIKAVSEYLPSLPPE
jgi:DNA-binding response OmpR family regulator